jgi:Cof subfamily protein (haloacid dehalogenase superfamily)
MCTTTALPMRSPISAISEGKNREKIFVKEFAADGSVHECRLILSDMDSTILPKGAKTVSRRTHEAFCKALSAGIPIGPSSGRARSWVPPMFAGDERCCATAVATNGLEVYLEGTCIHHEYFSHEALAGLLDVLGHHPGCGLLCFVDAKPYIVRGTKEELAQSFPAYAETAEVQDALPEGAVTKVNVFEVGITRPETQELVDALDEEAEGLDFDLAFPGYLNAMPAGWNKGRGIQVLCEALGCTTDEVVVFGDANNDLAMFDVVENSVAVSNATEEAAAAAKWHIGACADDAVAEAIEALSEGTWPFTA